MWTAKLAEKNYKNGVFKLIVEYTNGTQAFTEVIDMTGGDENILAVKVGDRLRSLNANDGLDSKVNLGDAVSGTTTKTDAQTFTEKLNHFRRCKTAVDLMLLDPKSPTYLDAEAAMKSAWDVSFIENL